MDKTVYKTSAHSQGKRFGPPPSATRATFLCPTGSPSNKLRTMLPCSRTAFIPHSVLVHVATNIGAKYSSRTLGNLWMHNGNHGPCVREVHLECHLHQVCAQIDMSEDSSLKETNYFHTHTHTYWNAFICKNPGAVKNNAKVWRKALPFQLHPLISRPWFSCLHTLHYQKGRPPAISNTVNLSSDNIFWCKLAMFC